jgi:hypothetical protein
VRGTGAVAMINFQPSRIFNRFFEMRNSTRNGKKFAEMRVLET